MKLRILFFLAAFWSAGAPARAESPSSITVAVYDFTDADKNAGNYGGKVTTLITADLTVETNLVLLERAELNKALSEQAFGISGMVNSEQAAKIGQVTGVKVLVSGQVIKTGKDRLVIVANIVGTETGRLFAEKVEGSTEQFTDLTSDLSKKIAQNIRTHTSSFINEILSHDAYIDRIMKSVMGTNRPSVALTIHFPSGVNATGHTANSEMGILLQKAGFPVVDNASERKPDIEISGIVQSDTGPKRGGLFPCRSVVEVQVQERRTGKIILIDRQVADAVDVGKMTASRNSIAKAVDGLAERILPLLAK